MKQDILIRTDVIGRGHCIQLLLIIICFVITMIDTLLDFVCGCISGVSQVFVMQPFELVKVRLVNQSRNNPQYKGMFDCFGKIKREEGWLAFYKGSLSPFIGVGFQVALQFGSNQLVKKTMRIFVGQQIQNSESNSNLLPMNLVYISGFLTGIPSSLAITPIDHTRIVLQNQKGDDHKNKYHGSIDAGIQIYRKYGIKGLYLGFYPTLLRQSFALAIYFGNYQKGMRMIRKMAAQDQTFLYNPEMASFLTGGVSGMISWLFTYPLDYIKTVVQADDIDNRKYKSATHCMKMKIAEEGILTMTKGLGVTMLRSFPVNGVAFVSFQLAMQLTGRKRCFQEDDQLC